MRSRFTLVTPEPAAHDPPLAADPVVHKAPALPATSRLALLHAYFSLSAYGGVIGGVLVALTVALSIAMPEAKFEIPRGFTWMTVPAAVATTWAAFRTRRLLRERKREGAWMAGALFVGGIAATVGTGAFGTTTILNALSLAVVVSVWRHLD